MIFIAIWSSKNIGDLFFRSVERDIPFRYHFNKKSPPLWKANHHTSHATALRFTSKRPSLWENAPWVDTPHLSLSYKWWHHGKDQTSLKRFMEQMSSMPCTLLGTRSQRTHKPTFKHRIGFQDKGPGDQDTVIGDVPRLGTQTTAPWRLSLMVCKRGPKSIFLWIKAR